MATGRRYRRGLIPLASTRHHHSLLQETEQPDGVVLQLRCLIALQCTGDGLDGS